MRPLRFVKYVMKHTLWYPITECVFTLQTLQTLWTLAALGNTRPQLAMLLRSPRWNKVHLLKFISVTHERMTIDPCCLDESWGKNLLLSFAPSCNWIFTNRSLIKIPLCLVAFHGLMSSKCRRPCRRRWEKVQRTLRTDGNPAPTLHSPFETGSDTGRFR